MVHYSIEHHDSLAINSIAHSVESARLVSDVPDAISCGHGIAIIEIDDARDVEYLEELLEGEDSVIAYDEIIL